MKDEIKIVHVGGKYRRKRIIKWTLTITLVGGFFAGVGVGFGYVDPGLSRPLKCDKFYSNWMSKIKESTKLIDVVMPGSHDAGSNKMMP